MSTVHDLRDFNSFALKQLANGSTQSITQLAEEWEGLRASIDSLRSSHEDAEAGDIVPANQVFAEIREQLGIFE